MFLIRGFKNSLYSLKGIFKLKDEKMYKAIIYFLLMAIISLLPHNLALVREDGFKLGFISEAYTDSVRYEMYNSSMIKVGKSGLRVEENFSMEEYEFEMYTLVIDYDDEYVWSEGNVLVLKQSQTKYYDSNGSYMWGNYDSFTDDIYKSDLMFTDTLYETFFTNLEKSFSSFIVLFSVLSNTIINILMYVFMIAIMAFILGFLRYRFSYFLSYMQLIRVLIYSMTIPTVVVCILGIFGSFAFTPVIMNFATGGIAVLVLLKVGKNNFELPQK